MPRPFGHRDVRLVLSHSASSNNTNRTVRLRAEHAASDEALFDLDLTPDQFAALMASREVVVTSAVPVAVTL